MRTIQSRIPSPAWWAAVLIGSALPAMAPAVFAASASAAPSAAHATSAPSDARPAAPSTTQPATTRPAENSTADHAPAGDDLTKLSLEDLMNVEVTSVSKQPQKAAEAPAAVTVISPDDIQRSGLQTVPDLLRLSPGIDVANLNANTWAIGTRGLNDVFSNKLLVLNDGRSVYTPAFSGVFWDLQEPLLADLDRIEVIRGPGATLYGSNAVDGVVNITSKSARDTQGVYVTGLGGDYQQSGGVRYGGQLDDDTFFRVYQTYRRFDDFLTPTGDDARDGWQGYSGGFRIDKYATSADTFTLQGDVESNREGQTVMVPLLQTASVGLDHSSFNALGADVLGRWTHTFSDTADLSVQAYYDHVDHPILDSGYKTDTGDLNLKDRFALGSRQEVIAGAEYRFWASDLESGPLVIQIPQRRDDYLASAFVQDDLTIVRDRLHLIAGTELEETSLGGFDVQPTGQLLYTPNDRNTIWTSVSRAVRTPSEWEKQARVTTPPVDAPAQAPLPFQVGLEGNPSFGDEQEMSYQLGYRVKPWNTVSLDASASYNHYDELRSYNEQPPVVENTRTPLLFVPAPLGNSMAADTYTFELAGNWQVTPQWRLAGSYSFLDPHVYLRGQQNAVNQLIVGVLQGSSPRNQFQVHSYWDITPEVQFNASLYYVDDLQGANIPAYFRTDLNVVWRPRKNLDLTVGVQNLFDSGHPEFNSDDITYTTPTEVPRTFYAQVTYHF